VRRLRTRAERAVGSHAGEHRYFWTGISRDERCSRCGDHGIHAHKTGRLLLATALLPQTTLPYELVLLALIPANRREMAIYLAGSWIAVADAAGALQLLGGAVGTVTGWPVTLCAVYLPMLYLVLRRPGCRGGPWIGKERRRPHRLSDDEVKVDVSVDDQGQVTVTVTHLASQLSMTESAPTRQLAVRKAHDKLAALLARTSRLVKKDAAL
jgi:hypothetical protein